MMACRLLPRPETRMTTGRGAVAVSVMIAM
jgi:hypothetical protein